MRIPLPDRAAPKVAGLAEFALRKGHRYAAIVIDAVSGKRIEVLPDHRKETVTAWLREHPGIEVVCRDGSGACAQATTAPDPEIVRVTDRWHLWHGLIEAVLEEVGAYSACWARIGPPIREGKRTRPPASDVGRSTTSSTPVSGCWNAPVDSTSL
ncbi:transposase [Embleya scabrispora]|uniref:transposase n=1 Tax=Embleya scabrispora TaxID=159449 RepID=UPI000C7D4911|nr:transposase [Embleya scabrispora]